jgi:hypothetical protein
MTAFAIANNKRANMVSQLKNVQPTISSVWPDVGPLWHAHWATRVGRVYEILMNDGKVPDGFETVLGI